MKVVCSKENLMKGLNTVKSAVPVRTTMDILRCVLLEAEENTLKLTANDTSLGIETKLDAMVTESGCIAIESNLFYSIIQKLPDEDVLIETGYQYEISIRSGSANLVISGMDPNQFITVPNVEAEGEVSVSQLIFREMIRKVIFSISDTNLNAAMSGVYLEVLNDKIRMTTLDGHRISIRNNELENDFGTHNAIIPGKTMNDLQKIISGEFEKKMRILFARNYIIFLYDTTKVVSRVIDGDYFKIDSMLRDEYETHVRINKKRFLDCLDRSTLLINESDKKPIILDIRDEEVNMRLKSQRGSMNESIDIEKDGKDLKIAFNPKLLMDALRVIEDEEVDIYLVKYNYPCTVKNAEDTYKYVILPVNFTEE